MAELEAMPAEPNDPVRSRVTPLRALFFSVAAVLVLGVVGYVTFLGARGRASSVDRPSELTLAVLPLSSRGADSVVNDMADGLSDEIAAALFNAQGIRVVSRATVGRYRGRRDIDARKVGQELGARLLMTGVLRGTGNRLTVTANLVDAETGNNLWANVLERYDGDLSAVREDIVREIQRTVRDSFGIATAPSTAGRSTRTVDPGAYRDYLLGQAALSRRAQSIEASANLFRRATAKDSLFAKAWSGLSLARALAPYFQPISTREVAGEVNAAAQRALQLDPSLAQPHIALGLVHEHAYEWTRAESELKTAVGMDARNVEARVQYGRFLMFQDRLHEALEQFLAARNEDPASALVSSWVAYAYSLNGQMDSALVEIDRAMQSDSSSATTLVFGALIRLRRGDTARAREYASRLPPSTADADRLTAADYRLEMHLWPEGRLVLRHLGRRFDTFAHELRTVRNQARVAGMLAHGITMPDVYEGAVLAPEVRPAELQVYDTHVTVVPENDDPWQVPLGAVTGVREDSEPPGITLVTAASLTTVGRLGRQHDACLAAIIERRDAQRHILAELTGEAGFSDGRGLRPAEVRDFTGLVERFTAPERAACAQTLLSAATADPRIGFVQLLDPDREGLQPTAPLPSNWAVFLLVPVGAGTVLEMLAGPSAATYVFRDEIDAVNRDLQLLHFRRAPLALNEEQASISVDNPHRLALRKLEPLKRLRSVIVARIIHNERWTSATQDTLKLASVRVLT